MSDSPSPSSDAPQSGPAVFAAAQDVQSIGALLERLQRRAVVLAAGGPAQAVQWCAANPPPGVMLIDISAEAHPLAALLEVAAQAGPTCRIVALGKLQDVEFYRQLLQAGIFDYLITPPRLDLLANALARADDDAPLGQSGVARVGRSIAVVGVAGGIGVSSLVASMGQWLAQVRQTPTVLVDFDRRKGDLPLLLGLQAEAGLANLLSTPEIDPRLLQRTLLSVPQTENSAPARLHLLAQQPGEETSFETERVLELGAVLCQLYSLSLWDLPSHRPRGADEVLAHADMRVVLSEMTVQGARNTHRLLKQLADERSGQALLLVASAAREPSRTALEATQFEEFVARAVDLRLPYAGTALSASLLLGPLRMTAHPPYAQAVAQLGARILGLPPTATAPSGSVIQRLQRWLAPARARQTVWA